MVGVADHVLSPMSEPEEIVTLFKSLHTSSDITEFKQTLITGLKTCSVNLLGFGSSLLNKFVQLNWTGPKEDSETILTTLPESIKKEWDRSCLREEYDGETWYELVKCPHLLSLANIILVNGGMTEDYDSLLWSLRCLSIQQQLLTTRSITTWNNIQTIMDKLLKIVDNGQLSCDNICSTHLEIFNCLLLHSQHDQAMKHLSIAQTLAGINLELSGALGKRTKFQQFDTAQLFLKVSQLDDDSHVNKPIIRDTATLPATLPTDVLLEDDTLLNSIQFIEPEHSLELSSLQQAVVLNHCIHHKWTNPVHGLTTEQLQAYLESLLNQPKCWAIHTMALYLRSLLERGKSRAVERSMMQLQEIVDLYSKSLPEVDKRIILFYSVPFPPHWILEKEFADTLVKLGANQSALEIYERLHLWDEVITCYEAVGRHGQAERVIRERMAEEGESVKLWCLLGDASKDYTCYEKAWELSKHMSARAQKSLGLYYLSKDKFEECTACLQKSVKINPLQVGLWFTLGHAANKIEDHTVAAHAYRQCVLMDSDNFEAWNNLAGEYVKLKDKIKAFNAFQEALKCNYENWKIWDNYLIISTDIGEFEETIRAYHRLLDIQRKHIDTEVLGFITNAVINSVLMRNGNNASELRKKLGELLGRVIAQTSGNSELWEICSKLHLSSTDDTDISKGVIELQKAQRTARQPPGWEIDGLRRERVFVLTMKYSKGKGMMTVDPDICRDNSLKPLQQQQLSSARLCIQGVVTKLKDAMELCSDDDRMKYEEMIRTLSDELQMYYD